MSVCGPRAPSLSPFIFSRVCLPSLITVCLHPLSLFHVTPFPSFVVHYLTTYFDLQIMEVNSKGGCKNGYLRHTDSNIVDSDGAHKSGCPGDQSLEEGELLSLLAPLFSEKAIRLLESR